RFNLRRYALTEATAIKDAVMANPFDFNMLLAGCRNITAQIQRTRGLATTGNIIHFTLHGQQGGIADGAEVNALAAELHLASGQLMLKEYLADSVEVIQARHIHYRQIFVIELTVRLARKSVGWERAE